jgi:hypothetical protein
MNSAILVTITVEELYSSETSVTIRATRRNNQEDGILHKRHSGNLKSYIKVPVCLYSPLSSSLCLRFFIRA